LRLEVFCPGFGQAGFILGDKLSRCGEVYFWRTLCVQARYGHHRFPDLRQRVIADHGGVHMRQVRDLVGSDHAIDDGGAVTGQRVGDGLLQITRLLGRKALRAAGTRQCGEIGIGEFDGFAERRQADAFGFQRDQAQCRVVIDDDLDGQLVLHSRHEFAHQHVEAAVAGEHDHLLAAIEDLHAVALADGRADRGIVERADDALGAVLADPVRRPQRVQTGVEHEDCIGPCQIAGDARDGLRVDLVLAAGRIGLLVEHLIPLLAGVTGRLEELAVGLGLHPVQQHLQRWPCRADDAEARRCAPAERFGAHIDLDDIALARQEVGIGIVGADHDEQVAIMHGIVDGLGADHAETAHPAWIIERHDLLAAHRMHQWRLQLIAERTQEFGAADGAMAAHDDNAAGFVDAAGGFLYGGIIRQDLAAWHQRGKARCRPFGFRRQHVDRQRQMRDARPCIGGGDGLMDHAGRLRGGGDGLGVECDVAKQQVRLGGLEKVDAFGCPRHFARECQHRGVIARRFIETGDEMRAAGPCGAGADAELAGELGLTSGGQRRAFLMPYPDPLDLAAPDRVRQRIKRVGDQAENLLYANRLKHMDNLIRDSFRHGSSDF
jgi:hypothetical protein